MTCKRFRAITCNALALIYLSLCLVARAGTAPEGAGLAASHGSAEAVVVAKVNGKTINMAQLMKAMTEISRTKHGSEEISPLLAEKIKQEATDKLITEELAYQKAKAAIATVPADRLEAKISAVKKRFKNDDEFQKFVKGEFGGEEAFRNQMERFVTLEMFISQEFDSKITVSDDEVRKAYDEAKAQYFVTDEFVQVNDLLFFLDPVATESEATIKRLRQEIIDRYGNDPNKLPADGSFALQKNVTLDKEKNKALFEVARGLKEYGWSDPVRVDGNLHIVQLIGHKPAVNKSLAEVTPYLQNEIRKRKRQEMLNTWMAGLKTGADIEIMDLTQ